MHEATANSDLLGAVIVLGLVASSLYGIWRYVVRPISKAVSVIAQIGVDWYGREGDKGHPRIPGVMERLATIESEVRPNGGGSLKDLAQRNAHGIASLQEGQDRAKEAAEKAKELAAQVHDELHGFIEEGQVREQGYLMALREVHGIDLDPPPHRDHHEE